MKAHLIPLTNAETAASHPQASPDVKSRFGGFQFKNGYPIAEVAKKLYEPPTFIRALTLWFLLFFALPLFARDSTDVLIMKNGDHLTCEIKALNSGVLYVSLPYGIQTLSVDWSQVASLQSKQLFLVKMEDGSVYRGIINSMQTPAGRPMEIQVAETQERKVMLDSARIVVVGQTSEKFFQRFTGGVSFGTIYSKGNQSTQFSISGLAAYPRERWAVQVGLSSNLSKATGTVTSTRNQVTYGGIHLLPWKNYFYGAVGGFLQSTEQGIGLQSSVGGGIGRQASGLHCWLWRLIRDSG
jgi:hypothetical protein